MLYTTLGRTGLRVSRLGLGGGGPSKLGRNTGGSDATGERVVRLALDCGVNVVDTAEAYGTEELIGKAIRPGERDAVVLCSKKSVRPGITADDVRKGLDATLARLRTDRVEVYHLHGVPATLYDYLCAEIVPVLLDLRDRGKIRFIGITEAFHSDPGHETLGRALCDPVWDVVMVGFNILNQCARDRVFPTTRENGIGTLIMFAVRLALSRPERLREVLAALAAEGRLDPRDADPDALLDLVRGGGAVSLPDAAYRFCRDEPGCDVILSGTGSPEHLRENLESIVRPPLAPEAADELRRLFASVDTVSGQ